MLNLFIAHETLTSGMEKTFLKLGVAALCTKTPFPLLDKTLEIIRRFPLRADEEEPGAPEHRNWSHYRRTISDIVLSESFDHPEK